MKKTVFVLMIAIFLISVCSVWLYGADKNNPSKATTSIASSKDMRKSEPKRTQPLTKVEQADAVLTAHQWLGSLDNNGVPVMLDGILYQGTQSGDRIEESYQFFEQYKDLFQMENPRQELKAEGVVGDEYSKTVKFYQVVDGIKVACVMAVHFSPVGTMTGLNGRFDPNARKIDTNPTISEEQAKQIAFADTLNANKKAEVAEMELIIARFPDGIHLAWSFYVRSYGRAGSWSYIIDAKTGKILEAKDANIY